MFLTYKKELMLMTGWNSGIYDGPLDKTIFKWMLGRKQHNQIQLVTEQVRIKDLLHGCLMNLYQA